MWALRIYKQREVLPGVYDAEVSFRQYFVDEDSEKAQKLANEINEAYENMGVSSVYTAEAAHYGD